MPWTYFSGALSASGASLSANTNLLTKVYFPRLILPYTAVLARLVDFGIALCLLSILMACFRTVPNLGILALPFLILLMMVSAGGIGTWLTALSIQYRDINYGLNFFVQTLMYATPVVYPTSLIPEKYQLIYALNPMVAVIEGFRSALLGTRPMPWDFIVVGSVVAVLLSLTGALYFRSREKLFADVA